MAVPACGCGTRSARPSGGRRSRRRTPPSWCGAGMPITVERSPQRCFADADYADAGCRLAPSGSWPDAPGEVFVLGLKELPEQPAELRHRHVYFGHAYKGQQGSRQLLGRFVAGGGALLDIEYLTDRPAGGWPRSATGPATWVPRWRCCTTGAGWPRRCGPVTGTSWTSGWRLADGGPAGADRSTERAGDRSARPVRPRRLRCAGGGRRPGHRMGRRADPAAGPGALLGPRAADQHRAGDRPVPPFVTAADADDPAGALRVICDVTCDVELAVQRAAGVRPADQLGATGPPVARASRCRWTSSRSTTCRRCCRARRAWRSRRSWRPSCGRWGTPSGPWPGCRRHFAAGGGRLRLAEPR